MRMSEKCHNNSDNLLTSRRTDGGKNQQLFGTYALDLVNVKRDADTENIYLRTSRTPGYI